MKVSNYPLILLRQGMHERRQPDVPAYENRRERMKNDFQDLQIEEYTDDDALYVQQRKIRRKKKRRLSRAYTVMGMLGCLVLLVAVMYLGMMLLTDADDSKVEDAMAQVEAVTYTQEELDEKLREAQEAAASQAESAAAAREAEILGGIRNSLESGVSTVETLRQYYPDNLVLVSGGEFHFVPIKDTLSKNTYTEDCLNITESGEFQYMQDGQVVSYKGIDVSRHQGKIDWQKVAADGVEFAFIRVALRGYGTGKLVEDEYFEENVKGAVNAGIKVGVYVYSQAISEEEVLEEAEFVLDKIAPYKIECPVVYDVEMVVGADGRMNKLTPEERTNLTVLFCQTIENAGYKPMIYHNMEMAALRIDLEALEDYDKWFAYYNSNLYYPYQYDVWQYSEKGKINGINGDVDMNISFVPLWEE